MPLKPHLMILGSHHMANPGRDRANMQADDVLAPKRQQEITVLVAALAAFNPTKIAVEVAFKWNEQLNAEYRKYVDEERPLGRGEAEQIGFRLARQLGHERIYGVDWNEAPAAPRDAWDYDAFAKRAGDETRLRDIEAQFVERTKRLEERLTSAHLMDFYYDMNLPETLRQENRTYFDIAQIGSDHDYVGANWVQHWYGRNLKIFVNLTRITESSSDRILVLYGAGHAWPLNQILVDSGTYEMVSPLQYLRRST